MRTAEVAMVATMASRSASEAAQGAALPAKSRGVWSVAMADETVTLDKIKHVRARVEVSMAVAKSTLIAVGGDVEVAYLDARLRRGRL
ncbi:hypothetical protein A7982_13622 [Minicystis rosea]|nr:hypothetical protein A7982_13622 [Minicystis rosea]